MLQVRHLCKNYHGQAVVNDVSFEIGEGEVFCLLGSNGAGKTTTLKILLGLIDPTSGSATLCNHDLFAAHHRSRQRLMYIPENVNLYNDFNALENVNYLAAISGVAVDGGAVRRALETVGLAKGEHEKRLGQYSKGMRQKVVIAFALLKDARLVMMDEPTSGLDPAATKDFIGVVQTLRANGQAVLMVTHDLQCAHLLADRIGVMRAGMLNAIFTAQNAGLQDIEQMYFGEQLKPSSFTDSPAAAL